MGFGSVREGYQAANSQQRRSGGNYQNIGILWRPPVKPEGAARPVGQPVVIVPAEYPSFFPNIPGGSAHVFKVHNFYGEGQSNKAYCTAGPDENNPQPCVGCYLAKQKGKGGAAFHWAMNIAHLWPYHKAPIRDFKTGQIKCKKGTNEQIIDWQPCLRTAISNCEWCGRTDVEHRFGAHRVLELGKGHFDTLMKFHEAREWTCSNCGKGIFATYYTCPNCKQGMMDVQATLRGGYNQTMIDEWSKVDQQCQSCHQILKPVAFFECGFDQLGNRVSQGCAPGQTVKGSIEDVVLHLQREGKDRDSKLVISGYDALNGYVLMDGRPLTPEILTSIVPELADMDKIFATTPAEQATRLGIPNPYQTGGPTHVGYPPPGAAGIPGVPNMAPQGIPGVPGVPGVQGAPAVPGMPQYPARPNYSR